MSVMLVQTASAELEAELYLSAQNHVPQSRANVGLLLVHPYSGLGGSMQDFVINEIYRQATESGQFAAVLRYNQRGVGRSKGKRFSLDNLRGQGDAVDVGEMVSFLAGQLPSPAKIIVIGYSFGAALAVNALEHPSVITYVGISFPMGGLSWVLKTKGFFNTLMSTKIPRLLVLGSTDQYTKQNVMQDAVDKEGGLLLANDSSFDVVRGATLATSTDEKASLFLKIFPDDDHFWSSNAAMMIEYVIGWCTRNLDV